MSAALTALSAEAPSDAIGLFKEELDAGGRSGFSFGDLLADRAGTTFARVAISDEAAARAIQARLAGGFREDDFFPEAADLPENIPDAELAVALRRGGRAALPRLRGRGGAAPLELPGLSGPGARLVMMP